MNCPKCNAKLHSETTMARAVNGSVSHIATPAVKCWCCGYWLAADMAPVMPKTAEMTNQIGKTKDTPRGAGLEVVRSFYDSIVKLRKKKTAWTIITRLIQQATGTRIKPETVQRNFERLNLQGVN